MSFPARYAGRCPSCEEPIEIGQTVSMIDSDRGRVTIHTTHVEDGEIHVDKRYADARTVPVVPRGKSAKDRCGRCFQIPANNGACGCDS